MSATYHMSATLVRRSSGASATAGAAYRAAERIVCEREQVTHDYRRKAGVAHTEVVMPHGVAWEPSRAALWNAVERHNTRKKAQVAREFTVALPSDLDEDARQALAVRFAQEIATQHRVAADVAVHRPSRWGDDRNHHAHILTSTNTVKEDGSFGNKARSLDPIAHKRSGTPEQPNAIEVLRERWEQLVNEALAASGSDARVDHRSYADRAAAGDEVAAQLIPQPKVGQAGTAMDRRYENSDRAQERHRVQSHNAKVLRLADTQAEIRQLQADLEAERLAEQRAQREAALQWWRDLASAPTPPDPYLDWLEQAAEERARRKATEEWWRDLADAPRPSESDLAAYDEPEPEPERSRSRRRFTTARRTIPSLRPNPRRNQRPRLNRISLWRPRMTPIRWSSRRLRRRSRRMRRVSRHRPARSSTRSTSRPPTASLRCVSERGGCAMRPRRRRSMSRWFVRMRKRSRLSASSFRLTATVAE